MRLVVGIGGVVGALALPLWQVGIGWPIVAVTVAVVAASRPRAAVPTAPEPRAAVPTAPEPRAAVPTALEPRGVLGGPGDRAWRYAAGMAAVGLFAMPGIRASGWLAALCVGGGTALAAYARFGGRTWTDIARGMFVSGPRALRSTPVPRRPGPWVSGGAAVLLLVVFGALFRAADPRFAALLTNWFGSLTAASVARAAIGLVVVALAAAVASSCMPSPSTVSAAPARSRFGLEDWALPVGLLVALFGVFVALQLDTMFAGDSYVLGPDGPDYAQHASGGSALLAGAAVLTLGVVAGLTRYAHRRTRLETALVRMAGGVLCGLTLVIVASAISRLFTYVHVYGFTVTRLLALCGEAWLALVFALVLVALAIARTTWLPRAILAAAVVVLFGLAGANPDAVIARSTQDRIAAGYTPDGAYLSGLSADAYDALVQVRDRAATCAVVRISFDVRTADPWYGFNLARQHARAALRRHPVPACA